MLTISPSLHFCCVGHICKCLASRSLRSATTAAGISTREFFFFAASRSRRPLCHLRDVLSKHFSICNFACNPWRSRPSSTVLQPYLHRGRSSSVPPSFTAHLLRGSDGVQSGESKNTSSVISSISRAVPELEPAAGGVFLVSPHLRHQHISQVFRLSNSARFLRLTKQA